MDWKQHHGITIICTQKRGTNHLNSNGSNFNQYVMQTCKSPMMKQGAYDTDSTLTGQHMPSISTRSSPTTPTSGGTLRIGRRSRSKSPFRSFRWKRSSTRSGDSDDEGIDLILVF